MKKITLLICIMLLIMTTFALAVPNAHRLEEIGRQKDGYMRAIDASVNFSTISKNITLLLGTAGIGIGACVGIIYAIMWVTATPSKKADLKERAYPLVLGVILLFGGTGLAASFISGLTKIL